MFGSRKNQLAKRRLGRPLSFEDRMLEDQFDDYFGRHLLSSFEGSRLDGMNFNPDIEMTENQGQLMVTAELPGMGREDVDVHLEKNCLVIEGKKSFDEERDEEGRYYSERSYGYFKREIPIPFEADEERVSARMKDGVLSIKLIKRENSQDGTRRIDIR
ncbi:MAG: Hsp20/alpha crystallin family protein [Bdellovibrionota bacterium]